MTEKEQFDYMDKYISFKGGFFANAQTSRDAELISKTLQQLHDETTEQAIQIAFLKDENTHMREVLEENRQLKQRIKELEKENDDLRKGIITNCLIGDKND